MGESRRAGTGGGLYERLLQRLALALEEADSLSGLATGPPQELELLEKMRVRRKLPGPMQKVVSAFPSPKPLLRRQPRLCCALCGTLASGQLGHGVQACRTCGSQLFRASNPR